MKEILKSKIKEALQDCVDYLDGKKSEGEKNFIMGRMSVLIELLKEIE